MRAVGGAQVDVHLLYAVNERGSHTREAYWTQHDERAAEEVREKCRRAEEGWVAAPEEWYQREQEPEPRVGGGGGRRRSGWGQSASAQSNYEDPDRTETENSDDDEEMPE